MRKTTKKEKEAFTRLMYYIMESPNCSKLLHDDIMTVIGINMDLCVEVDKLNNKLKKKKEKTIKL